MLSTDQESPSDRNMVRSLGPSRKPSRFLAAVAGLFLLSTVVHLGVFAVDGGGWSGPLSWRKPIVFSFSFVLLLWAVAWLLDRLPDRRRLAWSIAVTLAVASVIEVGLISVQTWRGRASHFNDATDGDSLIFALMGTMVMFISLALVAVFVWSLIQRPTERADRLAAWWGFALIMSGLGIGQWLVQLGSAYVERVGSVPDAVIYGEAGVVKYPHAVAFHGIQVFMIAAALAGALKLSAAASSRLLRSTIVAYLSLMALSLVQAVGGRSTTDLTMVTGALALVAAVAAVVGAATLVGHWSGRVRPGALAS